MALGKHVDTDQLIRDAKDHPVRKHIGGRVDLHELPYASRYDVDFEVPKYKMPEKGVDGKVAYQILHDELELDGNPNMNLASFVHTWVPDECNKLVMENINKNLVDQDEYPAANDIHERCVSMISNLWHAPPESKAMGTATTGSSEAIMLGGMALKKRWQAKMKAKGKSIHEPGPNIVMGAEAQVALEKFARYFEVECRLVPISKESNYVMNAKEAMKYVDENTIGVFVILGSTYTGAFESVQEMSDELDKYEAESGNHVPIHVDAASGGFVAPFAYPSYVWDFQIPRVQSINASGHKYGMSTVGVGWIIWRGQEYLPKELVFELHYLGATDYSFNLNFSRPAHPILAQMFNFLNLGFSGYRRIMQNDLAKARLISRALEQSGYFTLLSNVHRPKPQSAVTALTSAVHKIYEGHGPVNEQDAEFYNEGLPVVSFRFTDEIKAKYPNLKQAWMQTALRTIGWIIPNYGLAPNCEDVEILRAVVRESLSGDLAGKLVQDIIECAESLLNDAGPSYSMSQASAQKDMPKKGSIPEKDQEHIALGIGATAATWYIYSHNPELKRSHCAVKSAEPTTPTQQVPLVGGYQPRIERNFRVPPPTIAIPAVEANVATPTAMDDIPQDRRHHWGWRAARERRHRAKEEARAGEPAAEQVQMNDSAKIREAVEHLLREKMGEAKDAQMKANEAAREYAREKLETLSQALETLRQSLDQESKDLRATDKKLV